MLDIIKQRKGGVIKWTIVADEINESEVERLLSRLLTNTIPSIPLSADKLGASQNAPSFYTIPATKARARKNDSGEIQIVWCRYVDVYKKLYRTQLDITPKDRQQIRYLLKKLKNYTPETVADLVFEAGRRWSELVKTHKLPPVFTLGAVVAYIDVLVPLLTGAKNASR